MNNPDAGNAKTILVIEDEPNIVKLCSKALTFQGLEVDIATNGKIAQEMLEKKGYSLCLIDVQTPEMNGIELFQWMGDRHPEMTGRVIFTTGDIMGGKTVYFIEQSGRPFLPKPFTPDELQDIVQNTLSYIEKDSPSRHISEIQ